MITKENKDVFWKTVLTDIEVSVSKANFSTWFKSTSISKIEGGVVYLSVPNTFVKDWLSNKFHKPILRALRVGDSGIRSLEYVIFKASDTQKKESVVLENSSFGEQLKLSGLDANRDDGLNPKYTFDDFIVGSFNDVAYAAAQAVIENPGMTYNPLFIYGGTGLGKTHLIQAIGNHIKRTDSNKKIYYTTSEKFTIDYVDSVQNNKVHIFKEKYRKYNTLIMDDIQFLSGKEKTQEELFHLFNSLFENNRQIVFSSDKPPKLMPQMEERLRSRFEGGMMIDIGRPEYEARLAILKSKLKKSPFIPSDEIVEYVASIVQENIRELEGAINSIVCQSQLKNRNLSLSEIRSLIKNNIRPQKTVSVKEVIKTVAQFYSIEEKVLYEKTRRKEIVKPRQVIMYILREDFNSSYPYIGQKLGGRDHTTVIHACEKIKRDIKNSGLLSQEIDQIKLLLYNSNTV